MDTAAYFKVSPLNSGSCDAFISASGYVKAFHLKNGIAVPFDVRRIVAGHKNSMLNGIQLPAHNFRQTSKLEKNLHGFGMKIIEDIAEKYGGRFVRKTDTDRFIATVLLKKCP